jgi:hypothetical protein
LFFILVLMLLVVVGVERWWGDFMVRWLEWLRWWWGVVMQL